MLGIALMVLGEAWTDAMERGVVEPAKNAILGHVQVYRADAADDEGGEIAFIMPQNNYRLIEKPRELFERLQRHDPRIRGGMSRFMVGALLSKGETTMDGVLVGIDPRSRETVYPALKAIEGRHFEAGERGVLLNRGVAKKLGLGPGDEMVALGTTSDGRMSGVKLRVTGIYSIKGLEAYEWSVCFTDIASLQELTDTPDQTALLILRLGDGGVAAESVRDGLNRYFKAETLNLRAFTWEDMGGPFVGGMLVTKFIAGFMSVIMAIIVAASVLNTVLMAAFERTREIGTMRALGGRRRDIVRVFLLEGSLLGLCGALLGALAGASAIAFFSRFGIPAFSEAQKYTYGGDRLYPVLNLPDVVFPPMLMFFVCVLASLVPSILAARRHPAEDLRYV